MKKILFLVSVFCLLVAAGNLQAMYIAEVKYSPGVAKLYTVTVTPNEKTCTIKRLGASGDGIVISCIGDSNAPLVRREDSKWMVTVDKGIGFFLITLSLRDDNETLNVYVHIKRQYKFEEYRHSNSSHRKESIENASSEKIQSQKNILCRILRWTKNNPVKSCLIGVSVGFILYKVVKSGLDKVIMGYTRGLWAYIPYISDNDSGVLQRLIDKSI